jgi:aryl-alcohol dehydrogenase-like predicted oxidoreductase
LLAVDMSSLKNLGTTDIKVYPLNLGGNVFGWTADKDQSFAVLDAYTQAGGNFVDTADTYSRWAPGNVGGESETIIGEWLAARKNRDAIVLATKGGNHPDFAGLKPDTIRRAVDASLRRLGTDYIDLYYTHSDDESVPVEEVITTLDELVRAGKIREIAASNVSAQRLAAMLEFSAREGKATYVALQPNYNLVSRDTYEGELQDVAERYRLGVLPYFALASGFLTGKYRPGTTVDDGGRSDSALNPGQHLKTERGPKVIEALDEVARAHGAEIATVALAWLAAQPTVTAPIASARTTAQLPALLAVADLTLTDADLAKLNEASA